MEERELGGIGSEIGDTQQKGCMSSHFSPDHLILILPELSKNHQTVFHILIITITDFEGIGKREIRDVTCKR